MADYTQSITDSIRVFGPDFADNWGTMLWGDKWGYGSQSIALGVETIKSESFSESDLVITDIETTSVGAELVVLGAVGSNESLYNGSYLYVFPGPTTNNEDELIPTYVQGTITAGSWTSLAVAGGTWT